MTYRVAPGHTLVAYGQRGLNHQPNRLDPFGSPAAISRGHRDQREPRTRPPTSATRAGSGRANGTRSQRHAAVRGAGGQFGNGQDWRARGAPRASRTSRRCSSAAAIATGAAPAAQPAVRHAELLQGRPAGQSPPEGWAARPSGFSFARRGYGVSGKRPARAPERASLVGVPLRQPTESESGRVDVLGVRVGFLEAEESSDGQPRPSIRLIPPVPAGTGTPGRQSRPRSGSPPVQNLIDWNTFGAAHRPRFTT